MIKKCRLANLHISHLHNLFIFFIEISIPLNKLAVCQYIDLDHNNNNKKKKKKKEKKKTKKNLFLESTTSICP